MLCSLSACAGACESSLAACCRRAHFCLRRCQTSNAGGAAVAFRHKQTRRATGRVVLASATAGAPAAPAAAPGSAAPAATDEQRQKCFRCYRAICICSHLPAPVDTQTRFLILQSRTERFSAISTARIVRLGLSTCDTVWDVTGAETFAAPADLAGVGLLYPGDDSTVLGPGDSAPRVLVVLDGTWSQARRILRKNPWLQTLPQFALAPSPEERSNYRIRKQPAEHCLSTVECIARVLEAVEPERAEAPELLLRAFAAMVDTQIDCIEKNSSGTRRFHSKKAQRRSSAPALDAVAASAGASAPGAPALPPQPRTVVVYAYLSGTAAVVHWVALRRDSGAFFEARVKIAPPPSSGASLSERAAPATAEAEAEAKAEAAAVEVEEFGREWDAFAQGCERLALWNLRGLDPLIERAARSISVGGSGAAASPSSHASQQAAGRAGEEGGEGEGTSGVVHLKAEYARSLGRRFPGNNRLKPGSLIDAVAREDGLAGRAAEVESDLDARGALPRGRARSWLAASCAMAELVGRELQLLELAEQQAQAAQAERSGRRRAEAGQEGGQQSPLTAVAAVGGGGGGAASTR